MSRNGVASTKGDGSRRSRDPGLYHALRPTVLFSMVFGLLPLSNATCSSSARLRFRWLSFPVLYTFTVGLLFSMQTVFSLLLYAKESVAFSNLKLSVYNFGSSLYWLSSTLTLFLCLNMSRSLPTILREWDEVASRVRKYLENDDETSDRHRLRVSTANAISACFVILGLIEDWTHDSAIYAQYSCSGIDNFLKCHLNFVMAPTARFLGTGVATRIYAFVIGIFVHFSWTFRDQVILLFSVAVRRNFQVLMCHLKTTYASPRTPDQWHQLRKDHMDLCNLVRRIDVALSPIIMTSYAVNFHNICFMMYGSIKIRKRHYTESLFSMISMGYIFCRICAVTFCAGSFAELAKEPLRYLHQCPPLYYCTEVDRFIQQIKGTEVAFTGCKFFLVRRDILLVIFSSFLMYEIIWFNVSCS